MRSHPCFKQSLTVLLAISLVALLLGATPFHIHDESTAPGQDESYTFCKVLEENFAPLPVPLFVHTPLHLIALCIFHQLECPKEVFLARPTFPRAPPVLSYSRLDSFNRIFLGFIGF